MDQNTNDINSSELYDCDNLDFISAFSSLRIKEKIGIFSSNLKIMNTVQWTVYLQTITQKQQ